MEKRRGICRAASTIISGLFLFFFFFFSAGTWTLLSRARIPSAIWKAAANNGFRTSGYLGYWKTWANMARAALWISQWGVCFSTLNKTTRGEWEGEGKGGDTYLCVEPEFFVAAGDTVKKNRINLKKGIVHVYWQHCIIFCGSEIWAVPVNRRLFPFFCFMSLMENHTSKELLYLSQTQKVACVFLFSDCAPLLPPPLIFSLFSCLFFRRRTLAQTALAVICGLGIWMNRVIRIFS